MTKRAITAPYGFVPLNEEVVVPKWAQPSRVGESWKAPPLQDVPFEDGICGSLELEIEAETPIFTRGTKSDGKDFFELPKGQPALPGTTLKGALRNIVEIASFGHMSGRVNDHRYAVRDLHNRELYGDHMADIVYDERRRKREPMPLVNAGWLHRRNGTGDNEWDYELEVCDFAKLEYLKLEELAEMRGLRRFRPGQKQSSVNKYTKWGKASLDVTVEPQWQRPRAVKDRVMPSNYGKVVSIREGAPGRLVFTGQPSQWTPDRSGRRRQRSAKHHDFVFFAAERPTRLKISQRVFNDFVFAHSNRGQQNRLSEEPNDEWKFWQTRMKKGERVPVFFLADPDGKRVKAFGLAMMFRLPYRFSIEESVAHAQTEWDRSPTPQLDLADAIFGTVREQPDKRDVLALKSRVDFSHALAEGSPRPGDLVNTVLGAPKASYYPNYVEQVPGEPGCDAPQMRNGRTRYTTWQDDDCRPRGWKRYHAMTETWQPELPRGRDGRTIDLEKVGTSFYPLPAGTHFRGRVFVHNLRPVELGALLWAIELGGDARARHCLGMARPLGFGRCKLTVSPGDDLTDVLGRPVDLNVCREAFVKFMESQVTDWSSSPQILELLELARPSDPRDHHYQRLDPGARRNDFVEDKKAGLALPTSHLGPRPAPRPAPSSSGSRDGRQQVSGERSRGSSRTGGGRGGRGPRDSRGRNQNQHSSPPKTGRGMSAARQSWPGKKRGDTLPVTLKQQNKKGKWRAEVVGFDAIGTIEGTPPPDAAQGKEYTVEVIQGSDPRNLNLKWME